MLSQKRDSVDQFCEKTIEPQDMRLRTDRVGDIHHTDASFYEIIDQIQQQINCRFKGLNDFKFLEVYNFDTFHGKKFTEDAFKYLL